MRFDPYFFDCIEYLKKARICADSGQCWDPLRPVGANLYLSVPMRLGLDPAWLIVQNAAVVAFEILAAWWLLRRAFELRERAWTATLGLLALFAYAHLRYLAPWALVPGTDAPAAALALAGFWLGLGHLRSGSHRSRWAPALIGACFSTAILIRSFYLYPLTATAAVLALLLLWQGSAGRLRALALLAAFTLPLLGQFYLTQRHTGRFSFIDKKLAHFWINSQLTNDIVGENGLMDGERYLSANLRAPECLPPAGLDRAWREKNYQGIRCLLKKRWAYYFSNQVDRAFPAARTRSGLLLAVNMAMLAAAAAAALAMGASATLFCLAFLLPLLGLSLLLAPELRFIMAFQIAVWGLGGAWLAGRFGRRTPQGAQAP